HVSQVGTLLATVDVPDFDFAANVARCQHLAVGADGDTADVGAMAEKGAQLFTGGNVPELDGVIVAARSEARTVWHERHLSYPRCVADEGARQLWINDLEPLQIAYGGYRCDDRQERKRG